MNVEWVDHAFTIQYGHFALCVFVDKRPNDANDMADADGLFDMRLQQLRCFPPRRRRTERLDIPGDVL
jgi:hypothetical protein